MHSNDAAITILREYLGLFQLSCQHLHLIRVRTIQLRELGYLSVFKITAARDASVLLLLFQSLQIGEEVDEYIKRSC